MLNQGNFYIKQNPKDKLLSIEVMQEMLQIESYRQAISMLMHYLKNLTGTSAYWNLVKEQLQTTLTPVGPSTIYWTLLCAEFH